MDIRVSALIVMGGRGQRFGSCTPKQFHNLSGKPVFIHTLEKFLIDGLFHEIILISPSEWIEEVKKHISSLISSIPIKVVIGGATRRESSHAGLCSVSPSTTHVVIHDAVRPFVSQRILKQNIQAAIEHGAVDTCIASADTIVYAKEPLNISDIPKREHYLRGQTPQSFSLPLIKKAHEIALLEGFDNPTDDCSLVHRLKERIFIVQGDEANIKITTELDLYIAEQILRRQVTPEYKEQDGSVEGKTFILTGGSGGIGSSIEKELSFHGAKVLSLSRSSKDYPVDLTKPQEVKRVFENIFKTHGSVDGLINCIGALVHKPLEGHTEQEIVSLVETNLTSLIFCCKYAKIRPDGHIINISSSSYFKGRKDLSVYGATKAAVVNFTQGLSEERRDVKVNVITPQRTQSPMRSAHFPLEPKESLLSTKQIANQIVEILQRGCSTGIIYEIKKS